jgi:hypothetical protein
MSLFQYKVTLVDGKSKAGQITAKTEKQARERLAGQRQIISWQFIREKTVATHAPVKTPLVKSPPPAKPSPVVKSATSKPAKLDKLLYLQNGNCFFCGRVLAKGEASVEHLLPKSKGGSDADGNLVACCVTLNRNFGSMELKEKVRFVLSQKGEFVCPKS